MKCQVENLYVEPSAIFGMNWCRERLESGWLPTRIYNDRARQSASQAVFQVVNGYAAHPSRKLLTLHRNYQAERKGSSWKTRDLVGKLAQGSDESASMIGFWVQGSDKR